MKPTVIDKSPLATGIPANAEFYMKSNPFAHMVPLLITLSCTAAAAPSAAPQWQEVELSFTATRDRANHYADSEAWADFTHEDGTSMRRPMFWDGGQTFRLRFASTKSSGVWRWITSDRDGDPGLRGHSGTLAAEPAAPENSTIFTRHGFWSILPGGRNLVHADGRPRLLCADTAWALPWRATVEPAVTPSSA